MAAETQTGTSTADKSLLTRLSEALNVKIALTAFAGFMMLYIYAPIISLIVFSFNGGGLTFPFVEFSTEWYTVLFNNQGFVDATVRSLQLALVVTVITTVLSTAAALEGYKGVLYGQFMLTVNGPMVVEFNARFGDPEALNTLALLETDLLAVLQAARDGTALPELAFNAKATVCKYAVPAGYPTSPDAGASIDIDPEQAAAADVGLFYASVDVADGQLVTTTSRSFALVGVAETIQQAEAAVSEAFAETSMDGLRVRADVGSNALVERRIEHMERLRRR